jgi:hypothetical protein
MERVKIIAGNRYIKNLHLQKSRMLTENEKGFVEWWSENRLKEKKTLKQWLMGIPLGLLFAIPIVINFFSGWFKRADMQLNGQLSSHEFSPLVLLLALVLIVSFVAIFSKRYKWDQNEQRYLELKARSESDDKRDAAVSDN